MRQPPRRPATAEDLLEARTRAVANVTHRARDGQERPRPRTPTPHSPNTLAALLRGRADLRRAMLLHVVLSPPRSLDMV